MKPSRRAKRAARQLFRFCLVDGVLDRNRARQVAQRVSRSSRRDAPDALSAFLRLVRLDCDRHTASIRTAAPLADPLRDIIRVDLARAYGPGLETSFELDPALVAGMRIRVGSDVYDGSVHARLAALEARL
jgi:F-type H+-transporting ATPase subunit delta